MYSPRRLQHYTIDHGRLIGDQPVQPYLLDCISKLVEIHGLLDVAVCAQAITIYEIPLFLRRSHDDHGDSLGPRIAFDLPEDFDSIHLGQLQVEQHKFGRMIYRTFRESFAAEEKI